MASRQIAREEQACISNCIFIHWGHPDPKDDPDEIDKRYRKCLSECRICS